MGKGRMDAARRRHGRWFSAVLCAILLVSGLPHPRPDTGARAFAGGSVWGVWPMPGGSGAHSGLLWRPGPSDDGQSWSRFLASPVYSNPVVDNQGRIYVADSARVTCRDGGGEQLWACNLGFCALGGLALGPRADGSLQVYLGLRDPPAFVALDAANGAKRWQLSFSAPVDGAPAVGPDGTVYFGCDDGRIRAVSPAGAVVFEYATGSPVRSCPAIGQDGTIYAVSRGGYLHALTRAGALLWRINLGATSNSSAALGPDGLIYVGTNIGEAWCVRPDGETVYRSVVGGPLGWPAVDAQGQARFGSTNRRLYALDGAGAVLWSAQTLGQIRAHMAPLVDTAGRTFFGSADGHLRAVDADGALVWQLNLGSEPGALAAAADGGLVVGTVGGMLVRTVAGADPEPPPSVPPDEDPSEPTIRLPCSALPLNPVIMLSGTGYQRSVWGRFVTVMLRVPSAVAALGHPDCVSLGGAPGKLVARLPAASAGGLRLYLARFERAGIEAAVTASLDQLQQGKLRRVSLDLTWLCGDVPCIATLSLLFRP
ncbi:MAG: PQQ-binding-like beta-propeller repeat protein [Bacillota bacterium]|nr:PQQ-binding-like beta-propeller repeat protein [Bacillota bacterium]